MALNKATALKRRSHGTLLWFLIPFLGIITINFLTWHLWLEDKSISAENHLIENLQLIILMFALGVHIYQRFQESVQELRIYHLTLALLCFSVALREFDIDKIGTNGMWSSMEIVTRSIMVCAWLWIIYCVIKSFSTFWPIRWGILLSTKSLLTYTAIAFYLCSWFFDKNHVAVNPHLSKFIEECLQLAGTVYFLTSAMVPLSCRRKTMNSPSRWIR